MKVWFDDVEDAREANETAFRWDSAGSPAYAKIIVGLVSAITKNTHGQWDCVRPNSVSKAVISSFEHLPESRKP